MLVLSRRAGEQIAIGDNIRITLVRIDGDKAKIGIEAPISIPVYRTELMPFLRLPPTDGQYDDDPA